MSPGAGILGTLARHFLLLSVLAFGGANAIIPEIHRDAVVVSHWMSDRQFADLFAISQASPGPNILIVTLVGYHVAGVAGALVATAAMCGPACVLVYFAGQVWNRFRHARWRITVQAGLVPVSIGLIAAATMVLARAADRNWVAVAITVVAAGLAYATRVHPLWMFAAAGLLGFAGLV
jgi:chromate transporter